MRSLSFHSVIIGGYALLTAALTYPLVFHLTTHIPVHRYWDSIGSEHWTSLWAFWFIQHQLMELHQWSLSTDAIFYPRGMDLTNAVLLGFGLTLGVAIPFVQSLGPVLPFNLFIIGSFILTAYSTFLLVRYLTGDSRAAFISGVIFAFSPYQMARALTMFGIVTSALWISLYILSFIRAVRGGLLWDLILTPIVLVLTLLSNPYYAIFLGLFSFIYSFYYFIHNGNHVTRNSTLKRVFSIVGIDVLLFLPLLFIILTHWSKDLQFDVPLSPEFGADLLAFFIPSSHHNLWGGIVKAIYYTRFSGNDIEQTVYIGYIILLLSLIAIAKVSKEETCFWSLAAPIFFVLSLGPFLHIYGKSLFNGFGISFVLPLPSLLLYFLPVLRAVRGYSRFSIMGMLALVVLVGFGMRHLMTRLEGRFATMMLCLGLISALIVLEFSIVPLPLADARIPKVYDRIATEDRTGGTLLDVPLYWFATKYQYYQTAHRKRLLIGQAPRVPLELLRNYADTMPFMKLFRNPELIRDYEQFPIDKRDVLRFLEFFDISFIVLHKAYLGTTLFDHLVEVVHPPPGETRLQGLEVFDRLLRFLLAHFPIEGVEEEGDVVVLKLARKHQTEDLWMDKDGMTLDLGSPSAQFFLAEGWSSPERWGDLTVAWSAGQESRLWVYLPRVEDLAMEVKLMPLTFPKSAPQGVRIYLNGRLLSHIPIATSGWHTYTFHLPQGDLTGGINAFRFVYDYTESPAKVLPGSGDTRQLAVAFDYITFRPE
jgi:hypothetical protein